MKKIELIKQNHDNRNNLTVEERVRLLKLLKQNIVKYERDVLEGLALDLNKSFKESYLTEISEVYAELDYHISKVKKWSKPIKVPNTYQTFQNKSRIYFKPKGKVLIIVPFNYPFNLCLMQLIGSISAGNKTLIKMSNDTLNTNKAIYKIIDETFKDNEVLYIQTNELEEYSDLYLYEPNLIFFTGSTSVGKTIELECVNRNIEYVTEMGGMCPCFVYDVKTDSIYKRIVWAKFLNAGQTCVSINHIFYNKNIHGFVDKLIQEIKVQYPNVITSKNIPKIINQKAFDRLVNIIENEKDNILFGGKYDPNSLIIEPTIIKINDVNKIKEYSELFGPILFVYELEDNFEDYIRLSKTIDKTPLASYLFSNNKNIEQQFIEHINSGTYAINDAIMQICNHHLPFGGLLTSGSGRYHGYESFKTMSIMKPVLENPNNKDFAIRFINNEYDYEKSKKFINLVKKFVK